MKKRPMTKGFFSIPIKSTCIFYQEQPLGVPPSAPLSEAKDGFRLVLSEAFIFPVVLKCQPVPESPGRPIKTQIASQNPRLSALTGLQWNPRMYISHNFQACC